MASNGIGQGSLAGAIVGSIVGAAILVILAWLVFRRYRSKRRHVQQYTEEYNNSNYKAAAITESERDKFLTTKTNAQTHLDGTSERMVLTTAGNLSQIIPDPADDETVLGRILGVFDQASLHVDNFYSHTQQVNSPSSPAEAAKISQFDTPYLPGSLVSLLENPKTRRSTVTHTLIRSLLLAIQPNSAAKGSLLPRNYTSGPPALDSNNEQELSQAIFAWRMSTAHSSQHSSKIMEEALAEQDAAIGAFVESFTSAFAPYADPALSSEDRARHLRAVTSAAADLGRWLFGQPCAFEFEFTSATAEGESVVLPAVVKISDEKGRLLTTKVVLAQAVTTKF